MSITKYLKDGKVLYEVFVKVNDSNGKQVGMRRKGIPSLNQARDVEFDLKTKLRAHRNRIAWINWVEHFLTRYKAEYCNSTYQNYKRNLGKWVNPVWRGKFLDEITASDVHFVIFEHLTGVSSYTRKTFLKIIKRAFNMAIEEGVLTKNPAIGVKVKVAEVQQEVLNRSEIAIFLREAKASQHRFYPIWTLALLTGMRSGELHALRWTDVDFESGFISVNKSWTKLNGEGATKTAKNRVCPISKECRKFLQELKLSTGINEHVLPRLSEWNTGQQAQVTKDFCIGLGISPIKFHDLRATFITQMLNNGVALSKVMAIVGHSALKTTQGYLRLCGKDVEGATEDLNIVIPEVNSATVFELRR